MRFPCLTVLLLASCDAVAPSPRATRLPIIGGELATGDLAVCGLMDDTGNLDCTGTLVSRHVVVSAGHCNFFGDPAYVFFGSDPREDGMFVPVLSFSRHPQFDGATLENDISVVILAQAAPSWVTPVPVTDRAPIVGEDARFVGFGFTEVGPAGEYAKKYHVTAPITAMDATTFDYGVATCNGDSGGPAFVPSQGREVLVGVTSSGDPACAEFGTDTRVDAFLDWIVPILDANDPATCDADGRCAGGCASPDPDCPCTADGLCGAECPDPGLDVDCPPECGAEGTCARDCPRRDTDCPVKPLGEACETDFDCGDALCEGVCVAACDPAAPACVAGEVCESVGAGRSACLPEPEGCGCRLGRGGVSGAGALGLLVLCSLAARRRRHG